MKMVLYSSRMDTTKKQLQADIQKRISGIDIEPSASIQDLLKCLGRPLNKIAVMLIFIHNQAELKALIELTPYFDDIRLILILPDRINTTTVLGLKLNPSFISYSDSDINDAICVLQKINQRRALEGERLIKCV